MEKVAVSEEMADEIDHIPRQAQAHDCNVEPEKRLARRRRRGSSQVGDDHRATRKPEDDVNDAQKADVTNNRVEPAHRCSRREERCEYQRGYRSRDPSTLVSPNDERQRAEMARCHRESPELEPSGLEIQGCVQRCGCVQRFIQTRWVARQTTRGSPRNETPSRVAQSNLPP